MTHSATDATNTGNLTILSPGPRALLHDLGRFGYQHLGFTQGGPADEKAFLWANKLLQNSHDAPTLEISLGPFECQFEHNTQVSITGTQTRVLLNEQAVPMWSSLRINKGDRLKIQAPRHGIFSYLAVLGGFVCHPALGSCSTVVREGIGGNSGMAFSSGDSLAFHSRNLDTQAKTKSQAIHKKPPKQQVTVPLKIVPPRFISDHSKTLIVDVIPGYQFAEFSEQSKQIFFSTPYTITPQSDRMGYRLKGTAIENKKQNLLSEGVAFGSIQVPPNGQPIILLKDRQTIGGYPKIGCVSYLDCFKISQKRPGEEVRFRIGDLEECQKKLKEFYRFFVSGNQR